MKGQNGFSVIEAVFIFIIVGIISGTGWYVMKANNNIDKTNAEIAQSSTINPANKKVADSTAKTTETAATNYLIIKELGVKFALSSGITDASYDKDEFDTNIYFLRTEALKNTDCTGGFIIEFQKSSFNGESKRPYLDEYPNAIKINDNYFAYGLNPANLECSNDKTVQEKANKAATEFEVSFKSIQAAD